MVVVVLAVVNDAGGMYMRRQQQEYECSTCSTGFSGNQYNVFFGFSIFVIQMILHFYVGTLSSAQEKLELLSASYVRRHSRDHPAADSVQSTLLTLSVSVCAVPLVACSRSYRMALVQPFHHGRFRDRFAHSTLSANTISIEYLFSRHNGP